MNIAERVKNVSPSLTLAITAKAKAMKKQGLDVIGFGAGEPDFDTPDYIKQAAIESLQKGFTKYTPVTGTVELKQAICQKFKTENNLDYATENIAVSCGAKHSLYNLFQVIVNPGDEVLIPTPYWVSYPDQVILAGGKPVYIHTTQEDNYKITPALLKSSITPKTKALIINSPSNPSGAMYTADELAAIAEVCVERSLPVVSDEIYEHLAYEFAHVSIASISPEMKKLTAVVNGVSKSYSMTGWRIGYLAADKEIIKGIDNVQGHSTSNPTSFAQPATEAALRGGLEFVHMMKKEFKARRDYMVQKLNSIKGISCLMPEGAFYAFPDISALGKGSMEFCDALLEKAHVAAVPGIAFGHNSNIRLSYACSMESIKKGLDRLEDFVNKNF
ncbi:MAG: pyridoxal phosphate-dependent aminotransferase [Candidatus Auribacterota bacterium]